MPIKLFIHQMCFQVFQENFVEKPRNFALDVYVTVSQQMTSQKISCTLSTPALSVSRRYNMSGILHDSKFAAKDQHGIHVSFFLTPFATITKPFRVIELFYSIFNLVLS